MKTAIPTQAPLQIKLVARLDAPPAEVFNWMTYRLPEWFSQIDQVAYDNSVASTDDGTVGQGSVRTCGMGKNSVVEVMTEFVPGASYRYRTDADRTTLKMPIRNHEGSVEVSGGAAEGTSVVTWQQFFVPPRGPLGKFIRWNMREKMMRPGLAKLVGELGGSVQK